MLQGGDFYTEDDQDEYSYDPAPDLTIKPFAWPMIVQAAGLRPGRGSRLKPTPAGRKVLAGPAHDGIAAAWTASGGQHPARTSTAGSALSRVRARPPYGA